MSRSLAARQAKRRRLDEANAVIGTVARYGRRFFFSPSTGQISRFEIDLTGRLWLLDKYTLRQVYVAYRGRWRHFSDGGTLRALIEGLANYIRTGQPIRAGHFGPWPDDYCRGDLWGYGKDQMALLRGELGASPAVGWPAPMPIEEAERINAELCNLYFQVNRLAGTRPDLDVLRGRSIEDLITAVKLVDRHNQAAIAAAMAKGSGYTLTVVPAIPFVLRAHAMLAAAPQARPEGAAA